VETSYSVINQLVQVPEWAFKREIKYKSEKKKKESRVRVREYVGSVKAGE
jgi:hypothetical protein